MELSLTCRRCDVQLVAATEDELVQRVQEHVDSTHSGHDGEPHVVTRENVLNRLRHAHRRRPHGSQETP